MSTARYATAGSAIRTLRGCQEVSPRCSLAELGGETKVIQVPRFGATMTTINHERLLERFIRYVQVETTAGDITKAVPSSPGQLVLGKIIVEELKAIGLKDA